VTPWLYFNTLQGITIPSCFPFKKYNNKPLRNRESAVTALSGIIPDRLPFVPLIDTSYSAACAKMQFFEYFLNTRAYASELVETLDRHPNIAGVSINIGFSDDVILDQKKHVSIYIEMTTRNDNRRSDMDDSGGCCLGRNTPPQNVGAILNTCEDFGFYNS